MSVRRLAEAAGISSSTLRAIEHDDVEPSLQVLARLSIVLGMSLGLRLYPGTGPLIRDHIQAAIVSALIEVRHERWRPRPEVTVYRPVRGVIDLVLDRVADATAAAAVVAPAAEVDCIACEAHSELRRIEQQVRWSHAKADALATAHEERGEGRSPLRVGRLLLLRSTARTRAVVAEHAALVAAAYPARSEDAYAALTSLAPWPGDALLWCRVESGEATILERPPRGIRVGR